MNVERKNAKDDLRLYIPEVIGMLKAGRKVPRQCMFMLARCVPMRSFVQRKGIRKTSLLPCPCRRFSPLRG